MKRTPVVVHRPTKEFTYDNISITTTPKKVAGWYFAKIAHEGRPLYIETPDVLTKSGIVKLNSQTVCDIVLSPTEHEEVLEWFEELVLKNKRTVIKSKLGDMSRFKCKFNVLDYTIFTFNDHDDADGDDFTGTRQQMVDLLVSDNTDINELVKSLGWVQGKPKSLKIKLKEISGLALLKYIAVSSYRCNGLTSEAELELEELKKLIPIYLNEFL